MATIVDDESPGAHPPQDHPLSRLAVRLGELLDEDQWAECESLVLKAWKASDKDRTALAGLPDGALDGGWTAAEMSAYAKRLEDALEDMRGTLKGIVDADWRTWQELSSPDEFVRWAKARANHALVRGLASCTRFDETKKLVMPELRGFVENGMQVGRKSFPRV